MMMDSFPPSEDLNWQAVTVTAGLWAPPVGGHTAFYKVGGSAPWLLIKISYDSITQGQRLNQSLKEESLPSVSGCWQRVPAHHAHIYDLCILSASGPSGFIYRRRKKVVLYKLLSLGPLMW